MPSTDSSFSVEIVTTGTEILLGEIVDTNAAWIAQQLRDAGVNLYYKTTVGDNEARLRSVLQLGLSRSNVIIVTGGLGPTVDDITRQAIAGAVGRDLVMDDGALETLRTRFQRFGAQMTDNNRQQALLPAGAEMIPNPVGTAPGFIVEAEQGAIIAIPGVPREMKRLMTDSVLPYLAKKSGQPSVIRRRILRTIDIGESRLDDLLSKFMHESNPTMGLAAKTAQADVRITARAETESAAEAMIDEMAASIHELIGEYVYSTTPDESIESVVVQLLAAQQKTVSLLETNTLGRVRGRLEAVERGKDVVRYGVEVRQGELSQAIVDVLFIPGADTKDEDVLCVAHTLRNISDASLGLAIVGSYEADGGIYDAGDGQTWIGLVGEGAEEVRQLSYGSTEDFSTTRIGNQALTMLWRVLR